MTELEKILAYEKIPVPERKKKALVPSYPYDQEVHVTCVCACAHASCVAVLFLCA